MIELSAHKKIELFSCGRYIAARKIFKKSPDEEVVDRRGHNARGGEKKPLRCGVHYRSCGSQCGGAGGT